jgi:predicted dehydrogenase
VDQARGVLGDVPAYPDHRAMLAREDLDVLTIGTRSEHHAAVTRDAAARGIRGIYCEKPMAASLADADAMIEACRASGTVLFIGHQRRWLEGTVRVREAIADGAIGRPTHGYLYWPTGRIGSNGTHFFDLLTFVLQSTPAEVVATLHPGLDLTLVDDDPNLRPQLEHDPGGCGFVTYANGVRIAVDCRSDLLLPYTYVFCGTRGRLEVTEDSEGSWEIEYRARAADTRSFRECRIPPPRRAFPQPRAYARGEAEREGYRHLIHCIETGERPVSSGEDGRLALEIVVAFHLSSDAGTRPVAWPLPAAARDYHLVIR